MSNTGGRREQQKARTRARIQAAAQDLFAEHGFDEVTVVHIAATARVSVQTVFNHFAGKEELFFSERAAWVEGPAAAVRSRACGEPARTALRRHLVASIAEYARATADPRHRRMVEVLDATPALQAYERGLHEEAIARLGEALAEADGGVGRDAASAAETRFLAGVTASIWLAAIRSTALLVRSGPAPDDEAVRAVVAFTDRVLGELDSGLSFAEAAGGTTARSVA